MTIEAVRPGQFRETGESKRHLLIEPKEYKKMAGAVEWVLSNSEFSAKYPGITKELDMKYALAVALIKDGRYPEPVSLLKGFIPPKDVIGKLSPEKQEEIHVKGKEFKDSLTLLLMQKGHLDPDSKEADEAQEEVSRYINREELLKNLQGVLPIHVMGAVTNAFLFADITDEKKKEKLRGWTTRALLRPHLGDLAVSPPKGGLDFRDLVELIPEQIFRDVDATALRIAKDYLFNYAMKLFANTEKEGFVRLKGIIEDEASDVKREFLEEVLEEFEQVKNVSIPDKFVSTLETWSGEESYFPHFRQKYFVHEFLKTRRNLLNGDTGAGKTACAYLAMETVGAQKVTIFGPAKARNTWPREAEKVFREDSPDVFTIRTQKDLYDKRVETAKYVFVSSELLSKTWNNPLVHNDIVKALVEKRKTDGVILDESDEFRKETANCSKFLMELVTKMRKNHEQEEMLPMPVVALTATPISSSLKDLDIPVALLYPERFVLPNTYEDGKYPFSTQALRDPQIAYLLLHGEKLMIQWTLEDMYGEKAPALDFRPEFRTTVTMSPSQRIIYEWVYNLPVGTLDKINLLRSVLLNPEMIKATLKKRGLMPDFDRNIQQLGERLEELHVAWMEWMFAKDLRIPDENFSADWIAKYDKDFYLECFFNEKLIDGVESLAQRYPLIREDWQKREEVSGKYYAARQLLQQGITKEDGNYKPCEKTFFISPYRRRGVTRFLDDTSINDEDLEDNTWSFYEHIFTEWLPGLPREMAVNIDSTRTFASRDRHAALWREEGNQDVIVVASQDSVNESMDWAPRDTSRNKNIVAINAVYLGWPYSFEEVKQMLGRFFRPGLGKPVRVYIYESENTIDQGFYDLVRRKYLLSQIALAGVKLSEEDYEFFRRSSEKQRIVLVEPNVGQAFLQDVVRKLKGRGETQGIEELSQQKDGKTFFELFAEFYFDEGKDEFRIVGNNAELVKNIALRSRPTKGISVGAGSCLWNRKIAQSGHEMKIDNIDINGAILRLAKEKHPEIGTILVEGASQLSAADETYDVADYSFVLPWTKLYDSGGILSSNIKEIERVKIFLEMNRVLKTGGISILSFPESSFDENTFAKFATAMKYFGFSLLEPSGISYATDLKPPKRIGWVIALQKTGIPRLSGFDPNTLALLNEKVLISKYKPKKDREQAVVTIEYPIFSSKEFQIFNPLTNETSDANSSEVTYTSPSEMVEDVKQNLSNEQFRVWGKLRREVEGMLGRNYEEAEEILAGILVRRGLVRVSDWNLDQVQRIVHAEIRRLRRGGNKNGGR